ncbi:GNAT family N-acetyltransferase [Streptomyces sp. SL13]|uniref:GNAT family N-acetyltransferase n=1 Tax=Streptantibioticus silvisoli TaxID=2705255 RepID=A0AA90H0V1_9ACTN|nr:GNAT family N-acetyltransferase [Streptantibioticus silvisoli]MDI5971958.1 GNAT family N-acetyltransferase [Streptantibioticus silvisoli]
MNIRSLGFRTDVMLLRMGGSTVTDRGDHLVVRTPRNPGFWWGNFLLLPAAPTPADAGRRLAAFEAGFPGAAHRAFGVDGTAGQAGDPATLLALGLTAERDTVLTADRLTPPARPVTAPGTTEIRPLAGDADWAAALTLRLAWTRPAEGTELTFLQRQVAGHRALCEAGRGTWFGAFTDGELRAGAGVFADGHGIARYQVVETDPGFRRTGLAGAVVHHAGVHALSDPATHTLVIVADPGYHAIGLYRSLGFAGTEQQTRLQGYVHTP